MDKQKKSKKIKVIVGTALVIAGVSVAVVTANKVVQNTVKSGTVTVESINLQLIDEKGNSTKELSSWDPGDVETISWKVKNTGTAAVYTRNRLRVYWNEELPDNEQVLYLYPANVSKTEILKDIVKGDAAQYAVDAEYGDITLDNGEVKKGYEIEVLGDILDGSEMTGKSKEVNYNIDAFDKTTDDTNTTEDDIAYKLVLSPKTSYLYSDKTLKVEVVTEAMQCTPDGKEAWNIVDVQTLGD